jgi:hypothetical protein
MDAAINETLGDLTLEQALALARRLWRGPVWDLKIVAGRILAQKSIKPDAGVWAFVTKRLIDLDGCAVADNLASVGSRLARSRTPGGSTRSRRGSKTDPWANRSLDGA